RKAYQKIMDRLVMEYVICCAKSGALRGSASEGLHDVSEVGGDTFVRAAVGDSVASVEEVVTPAPDEVAFRTLPEVKVYDTPDSETIDTLVEWARAEGITIDDREVTADDTLKCMMVKVAQPGEEPELAGVLIPGSRALAPKRLEAAL